MKMFVSVILLIFHFVGHLSGQADDQYRNKNWNPKAGKYYFSTQITYSYHNDSAEDDYNRSGEISIYIDEKSGTFLFTKESYGNTGEMVDFVIADQQGNYIFGYTDEHGKKLRETLKSYKTSDKIFQSKNVESDFKKYCKPTGKTKIFGENKYGWPEFKGTEYNINDMLSDSSTVFLTASKYSFLPVFLFNQLQSETKLPVNFDFSKKLPSKNLILQHSYVLDGSISSYTLISSSPTEYFIDLGSYRVLKK